VLETDFILIICSEVLFKKIDYVGCLLHALLNYLIFEDPFSKHRFSKKKIRRFFSQFYPCRRYDRWPSVGYSMKNQVKESCSSIDPIVLRLPWKFQPKRMIAS